MAKALVVVESPAKAKTINKYLGRDYKVVASMGHIRDLPKSKLGVDVDNDFTETYESLASRKKVIKELKDAAKSASDIYVATDPEREREIERFIPEEYWNVFARLAGPQPPEFDAKLLKKSGNPVKITSEDQSKAMLAELERASWTVSSVTTKERKRHPAPPFITSK